MTRIPVPTACALVLALAGPAGAATDGSVAACTAQRLAPFVDPYGVRQDWPVASELPRLRSGGILLSDAGQVMDGYAHQLFVDAEARVAYVVQDGGIAGTRTIYGPLPVATCGDRSPAADE